MAYQLWDALARAKNLKWVDLTHPMDNESPYWSGIPEGSVELSKTVFDWGNPMLECLIQTFKFPGQFGTHIDFPGHFIRGAALSEGFGVEKGVWPLCVIDITDKVAEDVHYAVTADDIRVMREFVREHGGAWDYKQRERTFDEYFHAVALPQMKELLARYGKDLAVIFFDTPMSITDAQAQEMKDLLKDYPQIILNDRLKRPDFPGDYKTPEGRIPEVKDVEGVYWETCMNIGSSWGFKSWENKWKSSDEIIRTLTTIASRGGNLLLNVGPDALGNVPSEARNCLKEVGRWMSVNGEAVYGTQRSGIHPEWGAVIRKDGPRTSCYYLCLYELPEDGILTLEGIPAVRKASLLSDGSPVKLSVRKSRTLISVPDACSREKFPVIKLELKKKLPKETLLSNTELYFKIADTD